MLTLLSPLNSEIPPARKAVINVIVVCGMFFAVGYSIRFNDPDFPLEQASSLDYMYALEPLLALLAIMAGVRFGWLDWTKENYDRLKFPLSGAELLTWVGLISGICFVYQFRFPILPDASAVNWATSSFIGIIALGGLVWTSQQEKATEGKIRIWSVIWYALTMLTIGSEISLNLNMAAASKTERLVFANIQSKYSTTGPKGIAHYYYVEVTSPTNSNGFASLPIDRASWDRVGKGSVIKLRFFRGGLGQHYWQYER